MNYIVELLRYIAMFIVMGSVIFVSIILLYWSLLYWNGETTFKIAFKKATRWIFLPVTVIVIFICVLAVYKIITL